MVPYDRTHTFSNFPMSCVNFSHFRKCGKSELLHKEVWESVANCVNVPTSSKICVEKLNLYLSKKIKRHLQLSCNPQGETRKMFSEGEGGHGPPIVVHN